ncbi:MAG: hypothetical protein GX202_09125 [Firmicutes bacterium]|nr:hypothetical protein [Bacillota bacterium]
MDFSERLKEVAVEHFNTNLINNQASLLKMDNVIDFYTKFIYGLNSLSKYDKQVYRLGIKVYLSFDGDEELMNLMDEWEKSILPRHCEILDPYLVNVEKKIVVVRTLVHLLETMIENIIVKNRYLAEDEIREEISIVLKSCE